ncbi:MAG TPA: class I SAM-dependent methyltransferase [Nitriliruptorales bacterium]|nr:class I SAM-dependent methyltransferase [Nitriliruptorales bacterium]
MLDRLRRMVGGGAGASTPPASAGRSTHNRHYVTAAPSAQHQLDLFRGEWTSAVPLPGEDTVSGPRRDLFDDPRMAWMIDRLRPGERWRILELGPLEGGHTAMLEQAGATDIVAVEAHERAFLRCLVVKNLLDLRAHFLLGDFVAYLRHTAERFDLCVASGVLYHMAEPLQLLQLIAERCRRVFLWTHLYDPVVMARRPDVAARFSGTTRLEQAGTTCTGYRYEYREGRGLPSFCGGPLPHSHWITRDALLEALRAFGYTHVEVAFDEPDREHGPALAVLAWR